MDQRFGMDLSTPGVKLAAGVAVVVVVLFVLVHVAHRGNDGTGLVSRPQPAGPAGRNARFAPLSAGQNAPAAAGEIEAHTRVAPKAEQNIVGVHPTGRGGFNAVPDRRLQAAAPPPNAKTPAALTDAADDINTLKNVALHDPDPERRLSAVTMLGSSDDPKVIPILTQALSDKDEDVRMTALDSLSDFTDQPPVAAIESALNDQSADVRFEALDILSDIGGDNIRSYVEQALNDPDEDVRALAQGILDSQQLYDSPQGAGTGGGTK
jgi:HEAT repeats